jgi:hypothetical protein
MEIIHRNVTFRISAGTILMVTDHSRSGRHTYSLDVLNVTDAFGMTHRPRSQNLSRILLGVWKMKQQIS